MTKLKCASLPGTFTVHTTILIDGGNRESDYRDNYGEEGWVSGWACDSNCWGLVTSQTGSEAEEWDWAIRKADEEQYQGKHPVTGLLPFIPFTAGAPQDRARDNAKRKNGNLLPCLSRLEKLANLMESKSAEWTSTQCFPAQLSFSFVTCTKHSAGSHLDTS